MSSGSGAFQGKLALITGGGRGIGRAIALELARRGADVLVNYVRHPDAAEETAREARALGVQAEALRGNVADESHVERLFGVVRDRFGYLDFLINNSASGVNKPATELTAHHWDWTLNVNARGAWLCAKAALPLMQTRGGGAIVSISSLGAQRVMSDYFLVGVSKAALEAVTRYLSVEFAPHGVRVNAVSGGLVETDALKSFPWGTAVISQMTKKTPAGRMVEPEDLAGVVAFLCSEAASMIRGQTITVDGGYSLLA
ncbi:MAG TPA: enoyl-[acyl-carrier-protein] reductase FabL [Chloroflexota bacterium]|nr:enoyl-[acyl-carrier-protein] reductase FabL [Chloroflexota bacterium]